MPQREQGGKRTGRVLSATMGIAAAMAMIGALFLTNAVKAAAAEGVAGTVAASKAPVLLWEKLFDPPIKEISDRNGNGDHLVVQWSETGTPWKLMVLDGTGKVKREEILREPTKTPIPPEQAWLLTGGEISKISRAPVEAEVWGADIKVSDNGDYYAVLTRGEGAWYNIAYKDSNGKTLQTIVPRDDYGLFRYFISPDGRTIVVVDMKPAEDGGKASGQRVYFYNRQGLLKEYDYGTNPGGWLDGEKFLISRNGRYIAATRGGAGTDEGSLVLYDNSGTLLMEKRFFDKRHYLHDLTDNGQMLVSDYDLEKEALLVDREGKVIGRKDPPLRSDILVSNDGSYLVNGWDLIHAKSGKTAYRIDPAFLFNDAEIDAAGYADVPLKGKPLVLVFGYNACCRKYYSALVDFEKGLVLWRKEGSLCTFAENGKTIRCGNFQLYSFQ